MGGTFMSAFSPELLEIALSSKAGIASILGTGGFSQANYRQAAIDLTESFLHL